MRKILLIFSLVCLAISSCNYCGVVKEQLLLADALISVAPDSSLVVLSDIDTTLLDEAEMAYYALLLTKAKDKKYIFDYDDSLIQKSFSYYENSGDSLEVQSWFYEGTILSRIERYDEAIYILTDAYDKAIALEDWFYAGMSARELAHVYKMILYPAEELKWARLSKELFIKSTHPIHAAWIDLTIMEALIYNGEMQNALTLSDSLDENLFIENVVFRHTAGFDRIEALSKLGDYESVLRQYASLLKDGYKPTAYDYTLQSDCLMRLGRTKEAKRLLSKADSLQEYVSDSIYYMTVQSQLQAKDGVFVDAYNSAMKLVDLLIRDADGKIANPKTSLAADTFRSKSLLRQAELNEFRIKFAFWIIGCVLLILLLIFVMLFLKLRLQKKELLIDKYIQDLTKVKEDLNQNTGKFKKRLEKLFAQHACTIDRICQLRYNDSVREYDGASYRKGVLKSIEEIQKIDVMEGLMGIIDECGDGWMSSFRKTYPNFSDKEYLLAMYLYVGFRTDTITVLLGVSSPQAVHVLKHRLKTKMLKYGDGSTGKYIKSLRME